MTDEEILEEQNAYYMAGYPSRRSENKMDKEELEKENKVLAQNLEDTEILNKTYEKRFDDLKKENADLKKKLKEELKTIADKDLSFVARFDALGRENAELKEKLAGAERARDNLRQIGFPTFQSCKEYADKLNYAKAIIKDLLNNSDEYARQRAIDFLKEE